MVDVIARFAAQVAEAPSPDALFQALHAICEEAVEVKLFTCSRFDLDAGTAERIYSNDAAAYPLTGMKDIQPNRWTRIVLDERQTFCAETIEDLRDVFPDHAKIEALGLGAAINVPVFVGGQLLGTANLLDVDHSYSSATVNRLADFTVCATLAFLAYFQMERTV